MDALKYLRQEVTHQSYEFDVYSPDGGNSYDGGMTDTGNTVEMTVSDMSGTGETVTEGSDQDVSYRGMITPQYDNEGNLRHVTDVNDELRATDSEQRYVVKSKVGLPNDIDPDVWQLGLNRANSE